MSLPLIMSRKEVAIDIQDLSQQLASNLMSTSSMKIAPFTGSGPGSDIVKWLEDFSDIAESQNWDEYTKLKKFPAYLAGVAKDFYKLYVKEATPAVDSWSALCKIFREGFLPTEYTTHLRNKLRTKKQGLFQKTVIYIFEMQALCKQYNRKMPEEEIVDYIVQGLLPPIKERVIMLRPKGIKDLIAKAN